jgi:hypothetical protein
MERDQFAIHLGLSEAGQAMRHQIGHASTDQDPKLSGPSGTIGSMLFSASPAFSRSTRGATHARRGAAAAGAVDVFICFILRSFPGG